MTDKIKYSRCSCCVMDKTHTNLITSSTINYGSDLIASISKGNIFGTQFHPEKKLWGIRMFR